MANSDRVIADAEALLRRVSPEGRQYAERQRRRRMNAMTRTARRLIVATGAILAAMFAWGLAIGPVGQFGLLAAVAAIVIAWVVIVSMSREPEETPQRLAQSDLPLLPSRTEAWLQRQRPALPAPAARLVDGIGLKLETLTPQLAGLDPAEPAAAGIRKLLAQELPELIEGYARVPQNLRKLERDGPSPDRQLLDGLSLVDRQLAEMSEDLASGDLRALATQQRYLELKYKDGEEG
jgi:hypothetical protein